MRFEYLPKSVYAFLALLIALSEFSCQGNARVATRIPPIVSPEIQEEWTNDALASLSSQIKSKVDLDVNLYKRAKLYLTLEKFAQAESDITAAIALKDNVGEYYYLRARIRRELDLIDPALEDARRAEVLQQDLPDLFTLLADLMQEKKQYREAQSYLSTAFSMAPYQADAYYIKGVLLGKMSDTTASLENLKHALSLSPRMLRAYQRVSSIYSAAGNQDMALVYNSMALSKFPKNPTVLFDQGRLFESNLKFDSAFIYYGKAIKIDSSLADAHFKLANIYLKWKMYGLSITSLEKALALNPSLPLANFLLGVNMERLGNLEKASEYYSSEARINPSSQASIAALWRIEHHRMNRKETTELDNRGGAGTVSANSKTADTSRIRVAPIQPRRTIEFQSDTTRKITIK